MRKFILLLFCFCAVSAFSQLPKEYVRKAERELNKSYPDYEVAIGFLKEAKVLDSSQVDVDFLLSLCYMQSTDQQRALPHINTVINSGQKYNPELNFFKGYLHHLEGDFDTAKENYEFYINSLSPEEKKKKNILTVTHYVIAGIRQGHTFDVVPFLNMDKVIDNRIKQCESGSELIKNKKFYEVSNLGTNINTQYDEYAPVYSSADQFLYFTSRRPIPNHLKKESSDELYLEHIFKSQNRDNIWSPSYLESQPINSYTHNVSALTITNEGTDLFIFDHRHHGDIRHSVKSKNGKWSTPVTFDDVFNSENIERSFTINDDKTIAFIERDDKVGHDRDLFYSVKEGEEWSELRNAGDVINSDVNEDGVYLTPDGKTLYFSSDRYNSMGGYDIFKSNYVNGEWTEPENLGYPINSTYDDVFFIISRDGKFAFFSSNRPGGNGGHDIYYTDLFPLPQTQKLVCKVQDPESNEAIYDATVYALKKGSNKKYPMAFNEASQQFEVVLDNVKDEENFTIHVAKKTYVSSNRDIEIKDLEKEFDAGTINIKKIPKEIESFVFNDIYLFDVKSSKFFVKYHKRLETLINAMKKYDVQIVIEGHTDSSGGEEMNQKLSESRAEAVKEYLVQNGVSSKNILTKGYGESKPLNNNANKAEKALNRRVTVAMVYEEGVSK